MSLQVVTKDCTATPDRSKAQIVIQSTLGITDGNFQAAFDELNDPQTRAVAQQYAASTSSAPMPSMPTGCRLTK